MTKRWSSVRSDLVTTKRAASKSARSIGKIEIERQLESWYCDQCHRGDDGNVIAPTSVEEYRRRFYKNYKIEGYGIGSVHCHYPCPFCAAPEFMVAEILETDKALERGGTCSECGRSARAIMSRTQGSVSFEMVQTGGDDPPDWLTPKMRRVDV